MQKIKLSKSFLYIATIIVIGFCIPQNLKMPVEGATPKAITVNHFGTTQENLYSRLFIQMEGKLLFITNVLKFKKFNQIAGLKANNDKIKRI
jgi:hypothetical protein